MSKTKFLRVIFVIFLLFSVFVFQSVQLVEASGTVYIRADGSVDPLSAPIQRDGDVYTFTNDINDSFVVQRNNIVIDGAGYTLQGPGGIFGTTAITLGGNYVTLKNMKVTGFYHGIVSNGYSSNTIYGMEISGIPLEAIRLNSSNYNTISDNFINTYDAITISYSSGNVISGNSIDRQNGGITLSNTSNNFISGNNITGGLGVGIYLVGSDFSSVSGNYIYSGFDGISLVDSDHNDVSLNYLNETRSEGVKLRNSSENTISGNNITYNYADGIAFFDSLSNKIYRNNIGNNGGGSLIGSSGIRLNASRYNIVSGNNIIDNWPYYGVWLNYSSGNIFYHNIFINNTEHVHSLSSTNVWDNGYPSGGNYWSNYTGTDVNHDGIGDTPYVIDANNIDLYPLMNPWAPTFAVSGATGWYWIDNTVVNSVAVGDVDGDGQVETVTAGSFNDGTRNIAQLIVWNSSNLVAERIQCWYWTGSTTINSVALADVDGDGQTEIVTGGNFNDGTRNIAQLIEWNGANLAVDRLTCWYWIGNTVINSVAVGDVDSDGQIEVITGGNFNDGARNIAQLTEWNGANLAVDRLTAWYWTGNTVINSVAVGDVDSDGQTELVTGGTFFDGTRNIAQLIEWTGATLAVDRLTSWYWYGNTTINSITLGDADGDGQVEVVTGGSYFDGLRNVAQLIEWNGADLAVDRLTGWYWTKSTAVNSLAFGDVDADGQVEIVTGGQFNDGSRDIAQLVVWSGSSLAAENIQTWYWTSNTSINSVVLRDINGDFSNEIVTGGAFYDGTRSNSQLTIWDVS